MATIDDKLKVFTKIIFESVENDSKTKIQEFTKKHDEYLEEEKKKILKESEAIIKQIKKKAESKKRQIVARANMEYQNEILNRKKEIFEQLVDDIRKMAIDYTNKPEYTGYLDKCIKTGLSEIDSDKVIIYFMERDIAALGDKINNMIDKYKKPGTLVDIKKSPKNILGGCICEDAQGTVRIDCTMTSAIEDNRGLIGKTLADNLQ